jgi:integrase
MPGGGVFWPGGGVFAADRARGSVPPHPGRDLSFDGCPAGHRRVIEKARRGHGDGHCSQAAGYEGRSCMRDNRRSDHMSGGPRAGASEFRLLRQADSLPGPPRSTPASVACEDVASPTSKGYGPKATRSALASSTRSRRRRARHSAVHRLSDGGPAPAGQPWYAGSLKFRGKALGSRRGHGEGSVFQRAGDGKWLAVLEIGRDPASGKRVRRTITAATRREAAERLRVLPDQLDRGAVNVDARVNIAQWAERSVARAQLPRQTRSAVAVLSPAEVDRILGYAAGTTDAALWGTMALAGLRLGEALGLADEDVDLDAALLRVRRTLLSDRSFGPPKSERGLRDVPVTDRLERLLRSHRKLVAERRLAAPPGSGPMRCSRRSAVATRRYATCNAASAESCARSSSRPARHRTRSATPGRRCC